MNISVSYLLLYALLIIIHRYACAHTRNFYRFTLLICKHASHLLVYVKLEGSEKSHPPIAIADAIADAIRSHPQFYHACSGLIYLA